MSDGGEVSGGFGCLSLIVLMFVCWALCFGVTWDGVHHEVECSKKQGVEVKKRVKR